MTQCAFLDCSPTNNAQSNRWKLEITHCGPHKSTTRTSTTSRKPTQDARTVMMCTAVVVKSLSRPTPDQRRYTRFRDAGKSAVRGKRYANVLFMQKVFYLLVCFCCPDIIRRWYCRYNQKKLNLYVLPDVYHTNEMQGARNLTPFREILKLEKLKNSLVHNDRLIPS